MMFIDILDGNYEHRAWVTLGSCILVSFLYIIYHHARSPLRKIPGPPLAILSSWPLIYHSWRGNRVFWIMKQHDRYGPIIRISPTKVCVQSPDGIKQIYSNKTPKSHAYDTFRYEDVKMCIGLLDVKSAHHRRKGLLPAFSRQNLVEMEPIIRAHLKKFLGWLEEFDRRDEPIDAFKWYRYLTFDVISEIAFGQKIGMLDGTDSHFIQQVEYRNKRNSLVGDPRI